MTLRTTKTGTCVFQFVGGGGNIKRVSRKVDCSKEHLLFLRERYQQFHSRGRRGDSGVTGSGEGGELAFNTRVFCMLLRYETLFDLDQGTQGALPAPVFVFL